MYHVNVPLLKYIDLSAFDMWTYDEIFNKIDVELVKKARKKFPRLFELLFNYVQTNLLIYIQ